MKTAVKTGEKSAPAALLLPEGDNTSLDGKSTQPLSRIVDAQGKKQKASSISFLGGVVTNYQKPVGFKQQKLLS